MLGTSLDPLAICSNRYIRIWSSTIPLHLLALLVVVEDSLGGVLVVTVNSPRLRGLEKRVRLGLQKEESVIG